MLQASKRSDGREGARRAVIRSVSEVIPLHGRPVWTAMADVGQDLAAGSPEDVVRLADLERHGEVPPNIKRLPALKFICLIERSPDSEAKAFHEHWLQNHSQLVLQFRSALRLQRYVQNHLIDSPTIDAMSGGRGWRPNPYSGLTECWWASEQDMADAFQSEEGRKASAILAEDELRMSDSRVILWAAREYEIF